MPKQTTLETSKEDPVSDQAPPAIQTTPDQTARADLSLLYRENTKELAGYLRRVFGNGPPEPEDVAQEAFQKLSAHADLSQIRNLRAFLWRTARNIVLTHKRNLDVRTKYDFEIEHLYFAAEGSGSSPERVLEVKEQLQIIRATLKKMPERRRLSFLWHRVEGLSFTAVGRRLGITRHAVVKHVTRAALDIERALEIATE